MSEEKLDDGAFETAQSAFCAVINMPGARDIEALAKAILAYKANEPAAPKPAPERIGITEEERGKFRDLLYEAFQAPGKEAYIEVTVKCRAFLDSLAAAPKPAPERVGITEEEAIKLRSFKSGSDACEFWQYIDSLSAPLPVQGFEPDWREAGHLAVEGYLEIVFHDISGSVIYQQLLGPRFPRPAPAKLTDEEIDEEALEFALKGTSQRLEAMKAIENFIAKREELKEKYK